MVLASICYSPGALLLSLCACHVTQVYFSEPAVPHITHHWAEVRRVTSLSMASKGVGVALEPWVYLAVQYDCP